MKQAHLVAVEVWQDVQLVQFQDHAATAAVALCLLESVQM